MTTAVFLGFIALSLYLAIRSRTGKGAQSVHDFFVASRQFGAFLVFFLAAGEIYSIGTMVGFPGGIYAKGPTYGVWFLGYILLADRKSTRLNSSHLVISYAVFCLKKKIMKTNIPVADGHDPVISPA